MRLFPALALLLPLALAAPAHAQDVPLPLPPEMPQAEPAPGEAPQGAPETLDYTPTPPLDIKPLQLDLDALKASTHEGRQPADLQNSPLLRFKIEQAQMCLDVLSGRYQGRTLYNRSAVERILPWVLQRAHEVAKAQGDAVSPTLSVLQERAYIASNDGSAQPFWVVVPRDYSPTKKYGLAVFLHGYGPDVSKINPWLPDESAVEAAQKAGLLLVLPHGRRNTDFVDVGEDDVLRVAQEVQQHYSIDPSRVFLCGPSMGGFGTWAVGLHHPDAWAGLAPMSARTDFYLWFRLQRQSVPAWKRINYDADDPITLAQNATGLPLFFQHGALDAIVNVEQSRRMVRALSGLGIKSAYREIPFGDHYIYFYNGAYEAAFKWMSVHSHKPIVQTSSQMGGRALDIASDPPLTSPFSPSRVRYTSGNARNDGAYWVRITDRLDYSVPASINVQLSPVINTGANPAEKSTLLRVSIKNVAAFTLKPALPKDAKWSLDLSGKAAQATRAEDGTISWRDVAAPLKSDWPQTKSPRRAGPIKNAWRDPFLLVYGTQVLAGGAPNLDEVRARAWAAQWQDYADGAPRIKADTQVTPEDRAEFNLMLFGSAESNSLLREADAKLPLHWTSQGVRVGNGDGAKLLPHLGAQVPLSELTVPRASAVPVKQAAGATSANGVAGRDIKQDALLVDVGANAVWWNYPPASESRPRELGLLFCYASPWSSKRLIVVQSGPLWGTYLPFNHKWDLLPDWAVYSQRRDASDNTNQTLAAGFFGRNWELKP